MTKQFRNANVALLACAFVLGLLAGILLAIWAVAMVPLYVVLFVLSAVIFGLAFYTYMTVKPVEDAPKAEEPAEEEPAEEPEQPEEPAEEEKPAEEPEQPEKPVEEEKPAEEPEKAE